MPPRQKRLLLAVDGSPGASRAVKFVADLLGPLKTYQVLLLHVVRGASKINAEALETDGLIDNGPIFGEATRILTAAGFDRGNIALQTITGALSRAGAIVNMAEEGDWGTIVLGRRGWSSVNDFFMGRVSHKVVYAGRKHTVWIVT